jgi:hypothetical protein
MDIPIFPTDEVPQTRENVRIEQIEIQPYPDRRRIFIHLKVTAFLERPNLLIVAHDMDDNIVSELDIIETMHHDMEFTMHLRNLATPDPAGIYSLSVDLFYETRNPPIDRQVESFEIPEDMEQQQHE